MVTMSVDELLRIAGTELRILQAQLRSYREAEREYGPITRFIIKHFSKF